MKESVGGASLFMIFLTILAVFGVYVSVTINWSTSYKVKDEILLYIEKNKGMNDKTIKDIKTYTKKKGYSSVGKCPDGVCWAAFNINKPDGRAIKKEEASFCVRRMDCGSKNTNLKSSFYSVKVFFTIEVPIISRFNISIEGDTSTIVNVKDTMINIGGSDECKVS